MYESHFGFTELPFCLTPDTQFFLKSKWHGEATAVLDVCIAQREGFIKITGEVGTGKTMLCRKMLDSLPADFVPIFIPNPYLTAEGLFHAIAHELGIRVNEDNTHVLLKIIEEELVQLNILGHKVILVVDEAQSMPAQTLEALRLITNLETKKIKLLQVVLFGQPELDVILQQPALRQLLQRITFSYCLRTLDYKSTENYIYHRLEKAGYKGITFFDKKAIRIIYLASAGTPRLINVLSHKALMCAYGKKQIKVDKHCANMAVDDTEGVNRPSLFSYLRFAHVASMLAVIALSSACLLQVERLLT